MQLSLNYEVFRYMTSLNSRLQLANSWPYLDIKVFSRKYSYVQTCGQITAASDWPRLFAPRCFVQHIDIRMQLTVMNQVYCIFHFRLEQEAEQEALDVAVHRVRDTDILRVNAIQALTSASQLGYLNIIIASLEIANQLALIALGSYILQLYNSYTVFKFKMKTIVACIRINSYNTAISQLTVDKMPSSLTSVSGHHNKIRRPYLRWDELHQHRTPKLPLDELEHFRYLIAELHQIAKS